MEKITLRALRVNNGYTLETASDLLGISVDTLSKYERGKSKISIDVINKILQLYHVKYENIDFLYPNVTV